MKLRIYVNPDGHKKIAKSEHPWSWDFSIQSAREDDTFAEGGYVQYTQLAEVEVTLPTPEDAILVALARLKKQEQDIQAEAHKAVLEVQEERARLLSLTYSPQ